MMKRKRCVRLALFALCASLMSVGFGMSALADGKGQTPREAEPAAFELFTVSGRNSRVEKDAVYNAPEHQNPSIKDGHGNPVTGEGTVSGVKVSLAQGDTFHYTKVIDLTGKTKNDKLFEFAITPDTIGRNEVDAFEVLLTDAYDPGNVVSFNVVRGFDINPPGEAVGAGLNNAVGYFRAGFGGRLLARDHFWNEVRKDEGQGAIMFLDFFAAGGASQRYYDTIGTIDKNVMQIYYDDAAKEVYMHEKQRNWSKNKAVCDFDDEELFETPWSGFTTGECFLSIRGLRYQASAFNFVLTEVDGQRVSQISPERAIHTIDVDTLGFGEDALPNGVAGKTYPVFEAKSVSPYYGALEVKTQVYFGDEATGKKLAVTNGRFPCEEAGDYTLVYTADDGYGKTAKKTLTVTATSNPAELVVSLSDYIVEGYVAGDVMKLPEAAVTNCVGTAEVKKYISANGATGVEVVGTEYRFPKEGKYTVTYMATDMVENTKSVSFDVTVAAGTAAKFVDHITLPKYFIGGRTYQLPEVYARNYTDGSGSKVKAKIYVTDNSGVKVLPTGKFTPAAGSGEVTVTYDAALGDVHAEKEFTVPVIDIRDAGGKIQADKLFYAGEGGPQFTVNESDVTVTAYADAAVDYINPVAANGFSFAFCGDARFRAFDTVTLELADAENSAVAVRLNYAHENGGTVFYAGDGGRKYTLDEELYSSDEIMLSYRKSDNSVAFSSHTRINVKIAKTVSGEEFNGFPSGKVTVKILIGGVSGGARVAIKQVSNQRFGDLTAGEYAAPVIFANCDYGGEKTQGSCVTLPRMYVADAIDPGLALSISVFDPAGNAVTANDGTLLNGASGDRDYEITVTSYGAYRVLYSAADTSGNSAGLSYLIQVTDNVAPEITVSAALPAELKAGETLMLPAATASDKTDGEIAVNIYVVTEQGQIVVVKNGAVKLTDAGTYKVFYWCADKAGNLACNSYTVTVVG